MKKNVFLTLGSIVSCFFLGVTSARYHIETQSRGHYRGNQNYENRCGKQAFWTPGHCSMTSNLPPSLDCWLLTRLLLIPPPNPSAELCKSILLWLIHRFGSQANQIFFYSKRISMWCVCDCVYLCIQLSVSMLRKSLHLILINGRMSLCLLMWVLAPLLTTVLVDLERQHYLEESRTFVICKMKNSHLKVRGSSNNSLWWLKRAKKESFYDSYALKRLQDTAKAWFWPPLHGTATSGCSFSNWLP